VSDTKRVILCILDGFGLAPPGPGNAISQAKPQNFDYLYSNYPSGKLQAAGLAVGLPADQDGNSETGHLNLGSGRIVYQDLARINLSIADGSFFANPVLLDLLSHVSKNKSNLHLMGLIGASGVHAFNDHLFALLMLSRRHQINNVYLHLFTDGRDSSPQNALEQIRFVNEKINSYGVGKIATLSGRYYAMDRDMRLDRTQLAYDCLISNKGPHFDSAEAAILNSYSNQVTDEFLLPCTVGPQPEKTRICQNDSLIFYNFRIDRPRQLTKMIIDSNLANLKFATMTEYHKHFNLPVVFPPEKISNTLAQTVSEQNLAQLHASESEKERFVTYYFNGQHEHPFALEDRLIVPSLKIATYDKQPEMSCLQLVSAFSSRFETNNYTLGVINIANPDMVAHTGDLAATIKAISVTDQAIGLLKQLAARTSSYLIITADHGNAEELLDKNGQTDTKHSSNDVPIIIFHQNLDRNRNILTYGVLGDVTPTILSLLGIPQPTDMSGHNLLTNTEQHDNFS